MTSLKTSIKTITYLSDIGCLEIHGASLAGNICGGTFIFALMSHAQIRNDMSNKRKAEARQKAERAENIKKNDKNPA